MITTEIDTIMKHLSKERGIFHSEADFQHAFAWQLHLKYPNINIRLEYPIRCDEKNIHMDIFAFSEEFSLGIELKYKTRALHTQVRNETYDLQNQAAQDLARYDFIKDISRLESVKSNYQNYLGYAIILTNDSAYWKIPSNLTTVDREFRIHEGRELSGQCEWDENASEGTTKNREKALNLVDKYVIKWDSFSILPAKSWSEFKYLTLEIRG